MKLRYQKYTWLTFFILLAFSSFMSPTMLAVGAVKLVQGLLIVLIIWYLFIHKFSLGQPRVFLKNYIWLFFLIPWLSAIPAYTAHGQTLLDSAMVLTIETGVYFLYFLLMRLKVSEQQIINALTAFAFIYTFFELFQQITYPKYWFAGREENQFTGTFEIRQGMYKFYMTGIHCLVIPILFYWEKLLKKPKARWVFTFLIIVAGLYAFLARKMVIALAASIILSLFISKKVKWYYWFIIIVAGGFLVAYSDILFADYIARTQRDLDAGDNWVREQATAYFLTYFDNVFCVLFGNGKENLQSPYGQHILMLGKVFGFYRNDTGIYGYFNYFGIIGLIPVLAFARFFIRMRAYIPLYIKLYFFYFMVQLTIAFPLVSLNGTLVFVVTLYLIEINIRKNTATNQYATLNGGTDINILEDYSKERNLTV